MYFTYSELSLHVHIVQVGTDPLLWKNFPLRLEAGPRLNSFFGIARLIVVRITFKHIFHQSQYSLIQADWGDEAHNCAVDREALQSCPPGAVW